MNPKQQSQTIDDQRYAEILNSVESFIFLILFRSRLDYRVTSFIFKKKKVMAEVLDGHKVEITKGEKSRTGELS